MGEVYNFDICSLRPTQPNDGHGGYDQRPIEIAIDRGEFLIVHGHGRYYGAIERGLETIQGVMVRNPYLDF